MFWGNLRKDLNEIPVSENKAMFNVVKKPRYLVKRSKENCDVNVK